jgi:hypothetical protein
MDRFTRRRLEDLFREANFNELTAEHMAEAGVPEARRAEFVRRAKEIHTAYVDGDHGGAQEMRETAVDDLAEVALEEPSTTGSNDPRELAKQASGERSEAEGDDDPRRLSDGLSIW